MSAQTWRRFTHRAHRLGPDDAVGRLPGVALELAHRPLGERAEDAVGLAAREAERVQRALQDADVAAVEVRQPQVEQPVAEA